MTPKLHFTFLLKHAQYSSSSRPTFEHVVLAASYKEAISILRKQVMPRILGHIGPYEKVLVRLNQTDPTL